MYRADLGQICLVAADRSRYLAVTLAQHFVQDVTEFPAHDRVTLQRLLRRQRPKHVAVVLLVRPDDEG